MRACAAADLAPGEAIRVELDPPVAVFNVDGEFLATADRCSHDESSLADGYIEGDEVECAWHAARFCLRTGAVLALPATQPVATYSVKVQDGDVLVSDGAD